MGRAFFKCNYSVLQSLTRALRNAPFFSPASWPFVDHGTSHNGRLTPMPKDGSTKNTKDTKKCPLFLSSSWPFVPLVDHGPLITVDPDVQRRIH